VEKESARQDSIYRASHPDSAAVPDSAAGRFPRHGGLRIDPSTGEPVPENAPVLTPPPPVGPGQVRLPPRPRTKDPRRLPDGPRDTRPWVPPPAEVKRPEPAPPPAPSSAPAPVSPTPPPAPPPAPAPAPVPVPAQP
jgi:hypothetical protein